MTNRDDGPRDADELAERVAALGETREEALAEVAGRNESLQERLPGESGDADADDGVPHGEGAPGLG